MYNSGLFTALSVESYLFSFLKALKSHPKAVYSSNFLFVFFIRGRAGRAYNLLSHGFSLGKD